MLALRFVCRRHVPRACAHASLSTSAASSTPPPPQAPGEIETEENVDVTKRLGRQMESLGDTVVVTKDGVSDVQSPNSPFAKRLDKLPQDRTSGSRDLYSEKAGYLTAKQLNALLDLSRDHATDWPAQKLATHFAISVEQVEALLQSASRLRVTKEGSGLFVGR